MKKNIIWILISIMLVSTLVLVSCGGEEELVTEEPVTEEPTEEPTKGPVTEEPVTPPGGGNWWDKFGEPQYGGEIKVRLSSDPGAWDPYMNFMRMPWADYMGGYDWTVD